MLTEEKTGIFYLGGEGSGKTPLHYDSKRLVTHAVILGMTGSGKTGLGITLLEEAGLDTIPALIIDPKGDLTNLALLFPKLQPSDFKPWVDAAEAERQGITVDAFAEAQSKLWQKGLAEWGEDGARIQRLLDAAEPVIYTPANNAGVPLSILSSFDAPAEAEREDAGLLRDRIQSLVSGLLGLIGIDADPIKSKEHILISTLLQNAWEEGKSLNLSDLIRQVQNPPIKQIGALDIDTFFSDKERKNLAVSLNNLLASPGFQAWTEGEPLNIDKLLYTSSGKPKLAILSIAHLSDAERMFFVTLLLNALLSWMRKQSGTSSLRALLYMDEIFGFFPPTANPPSKMPMLTLLKQARAFGLGIVLSTQNPVDLDYKGLANCGTWCLGKLQTERDKARVLDGLKDASNGEMDAGALDGLMAKTGARRFILRSIYDKEPTLFETRWTLSYLRGPMTLPQIRQLTPKQEFAGANVKKVAAMPPIAADIRQYYILKDSNEESRTFRPFALGQAKLHFVDAKRKIDTWQDVYLLAPISADNLLPDWSRAESVPEGLKEEVSGVVSYEALPSGFNRKILETSFDDYLYQQRTLDVFEAPLAKMVSNPGESEEDFRVRVSQSVQEKEDIRQMKLKEQYDKKLTQAEEALRRAQAAVDVQEERSGQRKIDTWISMFTTFIGAFFGKKLTKGTIRQAGVSIRKAGRVIQGSQAAENAEETLKLRQQELQDLQAEIQQLGYKPVAEVLITTDSIRPKKSDITVQNTALVWVAIRG